MNSQSTDTHPLVGGELSEGGCTTSSLHLILWVLFHPGTSYPATLTGKVMYLQLYCRCFDWPLCLCRNSRYNTAPPEGYVLPVCVVSSCYQSIFLTSGKKKNKQALKQTLTIALYGFYTTNLNLKGCAESWLVLGCPWTAAEASPDGLWAVHNKLNEWHRVGSGDLRGQPAKCCLPLPWSRAEEVTQLCCFQWMASSCSSFACLLYLKLGTSLKLKSFLLNQEQKYVIVSTAICFQLLLLSNRLRLRCTRSICAIRSLVKAGLV